MEQSSSSSSTSSTSNENLTLIPDSIAARILISLPCSDQSRLRSTAREWHALLSYASVAPLRRRLRLPPRHILCLFPSPHPFSLGPFLYDPSAAAWARLPPFPDNRYRYNLSNFAAISLGHHLYVLGGSYFDTRSRPSNLCIPTAVVHQFDLSAFSEPWTQLDCMCSPRESLACASIANGIVVAGGDSVEVFDVGSEEWTECNLLPEYRSGCVGFIRKMDGEEEFWVMGGYYRPVGPENVYYKDVLVLELRSGKWRRGGDMWEDGERQKLGQVVVVDGVDGEAVDVFMLDRNAIFRFFIQILRVFCVYVYMLEL